MPWRLAEMTLDHYDELVALWRACEGLSRLETPAEMQFFLDRNPGLSLVALDDLERLVGGVMCGHDGRRGYLYHLAVAHGLRGQGVGRAIVASCLERLRSVGIRRATIFLQNENAAGEEFWRRLAWRLRDDLKLFACDLIIDE